MKPMRVTLEGGEVILINPARLHAAAAVELGDGTAGVSAALADAKRPFNARHTIDEFEVMWAEALRDEPRELGP